MYWPVRRPRNSRTSWRLHLALKKRKLKRAPSKKSWRQKHPPLRAPREKIPQPEGSSKRKAPQPTKTGVCTLSDAAIYYPTTADTAVSYLHAGVDSSFFSSRKSSLTMKSAGYECNYSVMKKAEGIAVTDCTFFSTTKGQLSTHIRQHHLGLAIGCFICPSKRWWSASAWMEHMRKTHAELSQDAYFVKEVASATGPLVVKEEVTEVDL